MNVVCILTGGPTLKISVKGKVYSFEDHPYCGPVVLTRRGDPASVQPMAFLKAASLWYAQGKRVEGGLCRWDHEPKEILKHLGGRHWQIVGHEPPVRGN
jgi:hypothetical protein